METKNPYLLLTNYSVWPGNIEACNAYVNTFVSHTGILIEERLARRAEFHPSYSLNFRNLITSMNYDDIH